MKILQWFLLLVVFAIVATPVRAQHWTTLNPSVDIRSENDWAIVPSKYHLAYTPSALDLRTAEQCVLPLPDGSIENFEIHPHTNFHENLAAKYPNIQSFRIQSINHPNIQGRLDLSIHGLHAVIKHPAGDIYIDPIIHEAKTHYLSYFTSDYEADEEFLATYLGHDHSYHEEVDHFFSQRPKKSPFARSTTDPVELFVYDLALSCTGEYAQKHGGTVEGALAAMNTALNRINFVFESELAIQLQLIEENDSLIHLDGATDPFTNGNAGQLALESNNFLLTRLGSSKYDVGHVFATQCSNIVGVSGGVGTVCTGNKGFGSSCETSTNDRFYIGIVCHELGHQFGAEHTWNNCPNSSDSQFNSGTAFEPGSGSTIMSYAGACGDQNTVTTGDFYYHGNSIEDILIYSKSSTGKTCAEIVATGNHQPTVTPGLGQGLTIPISTPFKLTGQGEDVDGDVLIYTWEQFDAGIGVAGMQPLGSPEGNGPIFRSVPPSGVPTRYLPALPNLVANANSLSEVLPTYSRNLTFRLTARDQVMAGGGVAWEEIKFKATDGAGPFVVTTFNEPDTLSRGALIDLTWDVANTNQAPVNSQLMDVFLSTDGGFTYSDTLAVGIFNDGQETLTLPDLTSENARIMIAAADNIFFDINDAPIVIREAETAGFAVDLTPHNQMLCLPAVASVEVTSFALLDFDESLEIVATEVPEGVGEIPSQSFAIGEPFQIELDFTGVTETQRYEIEFSIRSTSDTIIQRLSFEAVSNDFSDLKIIGPNGASATATRPELTWIPSTRASSYRVEISTSPSFDQDLIVAEDIPSGSYELASVLSENSLYYWRVQPKNLCGTGDYSPTAAFHTLSLACNTLPSEDIPVNISQNNVVRRTSVMTISNPGVASDVNVRAMKGFHESFGDLIVELQSPAGTSAILFSKQCGFSNRNFEFDFDDQAAINFDCQANFVKQAFQPLDDLSVFNGEDIQGDWTLVVHDSVAGSGGRIESWSLELCGSLFPEAPSFVALDTLRAGFASTSPIEPSNLSVTDETATAAQLVYTLVKGPTKGTLQLDGVMLQVGHQFTQLAIDQGQLSYLHTAEDSLTDGFEFTVIDGEGGWIGINHLPIVISKTSVSILQPTNFGIAIAPNPTFGPLYLSRNASEFYPIQMSLIDLSGRTLYATSWREERTKILDLSSLADGIYTLRMWREDSVDIRKIVLSKPR